MNLTHVGYRMNHPMLPRGLLLLLLSTVSKQDSQTCAWQSREEGMCKGLGKGQRKISYLKLDITSLTSRSRYI